ncbi:hypothetical protein CGCVW01_v003779 [Colletotrichum viniferum]|nr:hypothetical protein CGCVW01_v003779 [Colletotrichum viniferum]
MVASTSITHPKDWRILASQPIDSTLKLEADACDPISARLIDKEDVDLYWSLFFQIRNSFVGLLDPLLHTPEYVYSISFTLFSVVCSMGCGISGRARDRILYPTLLSIAEANYLPILDLYMGHSLLVLSATALKDMRSLDKTEASTEVSVVTERTFKVASRALNVIIYDETLHELILGIQNNMYIMIAHAITEIIQAIKRGCIASFDAIEAATKVQATSRRLEELGQQLPSSSPIHLYRGLACVFARELSRVMKSKENDFAQNEKENTEEPPDWLKAFDGGSLDSAAWLDIFLSSGQPLSDAAQLTGAESLNGLLFP